MNSIFCSLLVVLEAQDTGLVASLDALERQRGNQSRTNAAAVFGGENLDRVLVLGVLLLGPVENLTQSLGTAGLEVGVLVEDGTVGADVAIIVVLLLADGSNTTGREASGARTNKLSKAANEFALGSRGGNVELVAEEIGRLLEVLERIPRCRLVIHSFLISCIYILFNIG